MLKNVCVVAVVLVFSFALTEGAECCSAYTGLDLEQHDSQFCADYCCLKPSLQYVQCCDDINFRAPESMRDTDCISWFKRHIWVPIVCGVAVLIFIAVCTCCCCCGCCACCRNSKPGTVVVHQPGTALQATAVSVNNTTVNSNPLHVGYDYP